jgi:hypothetical protein
MVPYLFVEMSRPPRKWCSRHSKGLARRSLRWRDEAVFRHAPGPDGAAVEGLLFCSIYHSVGRRI